VCPRCPSKRERDFIAFDSDRDFVLRSGEREANPFLSGEQGALRQLFENGGEFGGRKRAVTVVSLRQRFASGNKRYSTRGPTKPLSLVTPLTSEQPDDNGCRTLKGTSWDSCVASKRVARQDNNRAPLLIQGLRFTTHYLLERSSISLANC